MPSTYNGAVLAATGGPTVNDGLMSWYAANGGSGTTLQELERSYLTLVTFAPAGLTTADLWMRLGAVQGYAGSSNDIQLNFWLNAGGAPPSGYAYDWTIGQQGAAFGYGTNPVVAGGALSPTDWPDLPGTLIGDFQVNGASALFIRPTTGINVKIPGIETVLVQIEGATSGIGPDNDAFTLPWVPTDYFLQQAAVTAYVQSKLGQQVGVNMRSFNNNVTIGTNTVNIWGWNNGLGLGALADPGSTYWPFGTVCVNFFVNAADGMTMGFNQNLGGGITTVQATVPGLNGGGPITLTGAGQTFTGTVAGATALFQQALAANMRLPCILTL